MFVMPSLLIMLRWGELGHTINFSSNQASMILPGLSGRIMPLIPVGMLIEALLLLFMPFAVLSVRKKAGVLEEKLNFQNSFVSLLGFVFLFARLIAPEEPGLQCDLTMTKLLPPMSSVGVLHMKGHDRAAVVYFDSMRSDGHQLTLYRKAKKLTVASADAEYSAGIPATGRKVFILGSDELGRDVLVRLLYSVRTSLTVGLLSALVSLIIGAAAGYSAGYIGGLYDVILSRFAEVFSAFPAIFLVLLILALFGNSLAAVIFVLGISGWMSLFKIVKAEALIIKRSDYFTSSRLMGMGFGALFFRETLPGLIVPVMTYLIFQISNAIAAEAALSFLGMGGDQSLPSWGTMLQSGMENIPDAWWLIAAPGALMIITLHELKTTGSKLCHSIYPGTGYDK